MIEKISIHKYEISLSIVSGLEGTNSLFSRTYLTESAFFVSISSIVFDFLADILLFLNFMKIRFLCCTHFLHLTFLNFQPSTYAETYCSRGSREHEFFIALTNCRRPSNFLLH